jgi:hypothetical protein
VGHCNNAIAIHMQGLQSRGTYSDDAVRWYLYGCREGDLRGFLTWLVQEMGSAMGDLRRRMEEAGMLYGIKPVG